MDSELASFIDATSRKYNGAINRYIKSGRFLPSNEKDVLSYIEDEGAINRENRLKVSSLKAHLAAIKKWHEDDNWPDPINSPQIKNALKRLKSLERQNGIEKDSSRFITAEECLQVVSLLIVMVDTPKDRRDRLITAINIVTGHRPGMVAGIKIEHLMNLGVSGAHIIIDTPAFKTDEETPTLIPFTGAEFCPASWLRDYIKEQSLTNGYIFKGTQQDFGKPLSSETMNTVVKKVFVNSGIEGGKLTSYTFRKTMATLAAMEGVNAVDIAAQGSWASTETVNKHYISKAIGLLGKAPLAVISSISKASKVMALPTAEVNYLDHDPLAFQTEVLGRAVSLSRGEAEKLHADLTAYLSAAPTPVAVPVENN